MRRTFLVAIGLWSVLLIPAVSASDLKDAIKSARREIRTWTLTPKIDLGFASVYHVYSDGKPTKDKQGQRYRMGGLWAPPGARKHICVEAGSSYEVQYPDFEVHGDKVQIVLFGCLKYQIYYPERVTAQDLAPDALARALGGFFDVRGPNLSRGGQVQARLRDVLEPIEVSSDAASFRGLAFRHPRDWRAERQGESLFYRRSGSKAEIRVQGFRLKTAQAAAGAQLLFTESFPDRLLSALRQMERRARLIEVGQPETRGPLVYGWSEGQAKKDYVAWHWVHDTRGAQAWEFVAKGKMSDAPDLRQAMRAIADTLAVAADPAEQLAADQSDVRSLFSETPTVGKVVVEAVPARVRHGEQVDLVLRFEVHGPSDQAVDVSQSWTLSLDGSTLPNYPNERQVMRARGSHEAAVEQVIPPDAPVGVYKLKSEVCVADACSSRTTTFEVVQ